MDEKAPESEQSSEHTQPVPTLTHQRLSPLAELVLRSFTNEHAPNHEHKISVNPFVSKVASAYEKLRNAMEYREEEVILRSTIERILRRRLLLGGTAKSTAEPLIRELIWARYLPDNSVPESIIKNIEQTINLYLKLRLTVLDEHKMPVGILNEWIYHLMSAALEHVVHPTHEKQTIANFMYQVLKDDVVITDDTEETRNAQVFLAVRRAFARDDLAFLRYHLFMLYFGKLTEETLSHTAREFPKGYKEINSQLSYPRKDRIFSYAKRRAAAFFILEDVLASHKNGISELVKDQEAFKHAIYAACGKRYKSISSKVRRAIIRSVTFIVLTKVIFAFAVEGAYERIVYGRILWTSLIINTSIPPFLMIIVSFFIRTPGEENTKIIYAYIQKLLFDNEPRLGNQLVIKKQQDRPNVIFTTLWLSAFLVSFGAIIFVLSKLHFTIISQIIFIFFVTIVSFLAYRISLVAHIFSVGEKQGFLTPFIDFLFMPVIRVGRKLTQSISQVNILLFAFDFLIETPFKVFFAFVEQWFKFLHEKSEDLG